MSASKFCRLSAFLLLLGTASTVLAPPLTAQPKYQPTKAGAPPKSYPDISAQLRMARFDFDAALVALNRRDNHAARDGFKRAESGLEKTLKNNPSSRDAAELLGRTYFYEGEAGDHDRYGKASDYLQDVVNADPDAVDALRYLAQAYNRQSKAHETIVYASQAAASTNDTAVVREMKELKKTYQEQFLTSWYEFGKYYESRDAKLMHLNPQNKFLMETVLQITPQFEQDLAAKGLQSLQASMQMSKDVDVKNYVQKLVDKLLVKTPGGPPFTYSVDIVDSPNINAMAFPGRILVNTGLLKFCDSEAELVTVLSHEIAHIYAHHSARALISSSNKRMIANDLLVAAKVNNAQLKDQLITFGVAAGLELLDRGYSRGEEKEADKYGTHIAFNAGYNPTFMTKFFLRLFEAHPKQPFKLLSTHPPTTERIEYTSSYLEAFPLETEMQIDSKEFKDMKARLK